MSGLRKEQSIPAAARSQDAAGDLKWKWPRRRGRDSRARRLQVQGAGAVQVQAGCEYGGWERGGPRRWKAIQIKIDPESKTD